MLKTLCLKKPLSTNQKDLYILAFSRVLDHKKNKAHQADLKKIWTPMSFHIRALLNVSCSAYNARLQSLDV